MNPRRLERSPLRVSSKRHERLQKYLKPGALAQLRNSRINSRSRLPHLQSLHIPSPPSVTNIAAQIAAIDALPCFAAKIYGPRFPQRKKLVASKSVFFAPSSPAPDPSDSLMDVFTSDLVIAH
ncbi:uncharacterized protein LOC131221648 [Magnolia sinica]|uniref:uncharacterized protein LOC131221648 n=1 Tax=Magnolia sinica TaxID=86752 RepID=UPI00265ADF97|nr:uncharacterized protein LOC131221648 [Magnolia sinica]